MKTWLWIAVLGLGSTVSAPAETVAEFVSRSIAHHGGGLYAASRITLDLCSKSGCSALEVQQDGGVYENCAEAAMDTGRRRVCITNDSVTEWLDGEVVPVPHDERATKLRDWVMARVYFAFLPYRLEDPSARLEDRGVEVWEGRSLRKLKVTFASGTSTDADDEFMHWFDPESGRLEQFAYSYERDGGGLRFRRLGNYRRIGGVLFFDQENFGAEGDDLSVEQLTPAFVREALRHVSTVELRAIEVRSLDPGP